MGITAANAFGNVIVYSANGTYWRISPEDLSCKVVARTASDFESLRSDDAFQRDWKMARLVEIAAAKLGPLADDRCYCLKIPAVLGGQYDIGNFGTNSRNELIAFSGDLARQVKDLPDGTKVKLVIGP